MKQITCKNCGSPDIEKDNYDCSYCGSVYAEKKIVKQPEQRYFAEVGSLRGFSQTGLQGLRNGGIFEMKSSNALQPMFVQKRVQKKCDEDTGFLGGILGGLFK